MHLFNRSIQCLEYHVYKYITVSSIQGEDGQSSIHRENHHALTRVYPPAITRTLDCHIRTIAVQMRGVTTVTLTG